MSDQHQLPMEAWNQGQSIALSCPEFKPDVEEEWLAEETVSCYNCRYRRFVGAGICCMKSLFPDL
ncbi:hypothetical protein [Acetobacterium malicum]|uniref:hypothetical protein n=1 Tax=Acetobacterium malicum TaxID=52692 RepID=UPI0004218E1F|nr:hypothetical protein [Acetobacterium dehalogenans]